MAIQDMVNNSPRTMETERFQEITIGLNPTTPMDVEAPQQQEEVSLDTTDEKDTVDNGEGGDDSGSSMPPPPMETPPPPTPDKDPDFIATTERSEKESDKQTQHESAESASGRAQKSAVSPSNEKRSQAATGQVENMDRQEPKQFNAHQFKQMLKAKIIELLPKDEDEADKFASSGKMKKVGDSAKAQVKTEKQNAAGNIENTTKQPLDTSSVPDREVEPLANPDFGQKPKDLNADKAMPKPLSDQQVEAPLDQGPQDLETQMKDNEITDEQLANSNEPQFISALGAKNDVKTHSDESKKQFRAQENQQLLATKQEADNTGKQGMESMHGDRKNALMGMLGEQQKSSGNNTSERARVSNEINAIYDQTKSDVEGILNGLDTIVGNMFKQATDRAGRNFENYIAAQMKAYKDERYDGAAGWLVAGYDYFAGLPDEVNVFFVTARKNYLREMDGHLTQIANIVANHLQEAKKRIAKGRQDVNNYVNDLPDNLKDIGKEAAASIQSKFDSLDKQVEDKQGELVDNLAKQYVDAVQAIDSRIEELKAANRGLLDAAWDAVAGVIEVINEARKTLTDLLSKALDAIGVILLDPIGAWNNIVEGVSQGLNNFVGNIGKHLLNGVVEWLAGAMGDVDIEMPENLFSLEGMFSLVGQVLGLSWEYFREKAVKHLGERTVNRLERVYEVFNVVREGGLAGLWEYLKDQFTNIKEMVLEEIRNMLIMQVVEAGIEWLLGMLVPGGAFIKAVKLIIDVVKFFVENWDNIIAMVTAFVDTISAVAYGNIGVMAAAIEQAMANTVPVIIGFLASLVGLDGMGKKVQGVIEGIRTKVDEVIESIIAKAKQWFSDTRGGRKKSKNKDKDKDKEGDEKPDERDDAAQKQDFDKAMNKGEKEISSPENTKDELITKVQGIKLKHRLEELKPLLKQNNEEAETWILSGELGKYVAQKEIKRQPSDSDGDKDLDFEVPVKSKKEPHTLRLNKVGGKYIIEMASNQFKPLFQKIKNFKTFVQTNLAPLQAKHPGGEITSFYTDLEALETEALNTDAEYTRNISVAGNDVEYKREVNDDAIERLSGKIKTFLNKYMLHDFVEQDMVFDFAIDLIMDELHVLGKDVRGVLQDILKHTDEFRESDGAVGDGHSASAYAAEVTIGWMARTTLEYDTSIVESSFSHEHLTEDIDLGGLKDKGSINNLLKNSDKRGAIVIFKAELDALEGLTTSRKKEILVAFGRYAQSVYSLFIQEPTSIKKPQVHEKKVVEKLPILKEANKAYEDALSAYLLDSPAIKPLLENKLKNTFLKDIKGDKKLMKLEGYDKIVMTKIPLLYLVDKMRENIDILERAKGTPREYLNQPYNNNGNLTTLLDVFQTDLDRQLANHKRTENLRDQHGVTLGNPKSVRIFNQENTDRE